MVEVRGSDGVRRGKGRPSARSLLSIFGLINVGRLAYQAEGVDGLHPADAAFNLPDEMYSHGVREWVAEHVARESYDAVVHDIAKQIGTRVHKRQVEQLAIRSAMDFEAFYATRTVKAEKTSALMVLTFDGAGLIMLHEALRPETQKAAEKAAQEPDSPKTARHGRRNRKRMAEVAAVYTIAPFARSVMDVVRDLRPLRDVEGLTPRPRPTPDGRVLVAGHRGSNLFPPGDSAVARFNANGSPDTTFGAGGRVVVDVRSTYDGMEAMVLQSDGKIVLAGASARPTTLGDVSAIRLGADGSLDPSFGVAGKAVHAIGTAVSSGANAVWLDSAGRMV